MMSDARSHMDRDEFATIAPVAVTALQALSRAPVEAGLEKDLLELVKVRASQINGCAYCLQFHLNAARALHIPPEKLDLIAAWPEAGIFTVRERAALAWTEALTHVARGGVSDADHAVIRAQFSAKELAFPTIAVATINAWNRIAGPLGFAPPIPAKAPAERVT